MSGVSLKGMSKYNADGAVKQCVSYHIKAHFEHEHIKSGWELRFLDIVKDAGFGRKDNKLCVSYPTRDNEFTVVCFNLSASERPKLHRIRKAFTKSFRETDILSSPYHSIVTHEVLGEEVEKHAIEIAMYQCPFEPDVDWEPFKPSVPSPLPLSPPLSPVKLIGIKTDDTYDSNEFPSTNK